MKKYLLLLVLTFGFYWVSLGQNLEIIPEAKTDVESVVENVAKWWKVWDMYNEEAEKLQSQKDLWAQMASGIFTWDTLLDYLAYLIKFMSEIGIFVWAVFIVYAWYLYATSIFTGDSGATWKWNKAIKNAIIWVIVITFSYAIMKTITAAFLI